MPLEIIQRTKSLAICDFMSSFSDDELSQCKIRINITAEMLLQLKTIFNCVSTLNTTTATLIDLFIFCWTP